MIISCGFESHLFAYPLVQSINEPNVMRQLEFYWGSFPTRVEGYNHLVQMSDTDTGITWGNAPDSDDFDFLRPESVPQSMVEIWGDATELCDYFKKVHMGRLVLILTQNPVVMADAFFFLPIAYCMEVLQEVNRVTHEANKAYERNMRLNQIKSRSKK